MLVPVGVMFSTVVLEAHHDSPVELFHLYAGLWMLGSDFQMLDVKMNIDRAEGFR